MTFKLDASGTYTCIAVSTAVVSESDARILNEKSRPHHLDNAMVMSRDTGWFIKLFEEWEYVEDMIHRFSARLREVIHQAHEDGYRMVELDADAPDVIEVEPVVLDKAWVERAACNMPRCYKSPPYMGVKNIVCSWCQQKEKYLKQLVDS